MAELSFRLILQTDDATGQLRTVGQEADNLKNAVEEPKTIRISADQALGTIRDVKIAIDGVVQAIGKLTQGFNNLLDAALVQRQAMTLTTIAFGDASAEMANFASAMQSVTNFGDEQLLPLMAKLAQTFKLNKNEVQQLVPVLLDFAEANKATGMTVESAFDLMGRALNGHTAMLGRYGIELDATRLAAEGVSYLVEKLGEDYGGTAEALVDLRTQNKKAWGDIKETVGDMLEVIINPLLNGLKWLMEAYNNLTPVMKGFVTGIVIAVPVIATITTAITALTAAYHALRLAINPVAGIIGITVGALSALGLGLAAASIKTDVMVESQKSMTDEIKECSRQVSIEAEKFNFLATRLLELRSATNLATSDKTEMKNIIRTMNEQYGEYIGNIDLATASYNDLASALRSASEALIQKQIAEVYGERYQAQLRRVAELQVQYNDLMKVARENQSQFIQDREMLQGGPGDYWKLSPEGILNEQITQVRDNLNQAKGDINDFAAAYRQALMELPDMSLGGGDSSGSSNTSQSDARRSEEERRLEQLRLLQQRYDTLSIDDAVARRQKELEIQRDNELAKAEALGSSEELLQSIRDHYAAESIKVEQDATAARAKQIEAETEAKRKVLEEEKRLQEELEDMRFNFDQRGLELAGQTRDAQLLAIDNYYEKKRAKLLEAGLTEEQITAQSENAKAKIREQHELRQLQGAQRKMGDLAKTSQAFGKKGFALWKTLAVGQAMVDTYASATGAYKAMVGIPIVGPGQAVVAAAAAVAAGLANVATIRAQEPPKLAKGGLLDGPSHSRGGTIIEAEGGEYVVNKKSTAKYLPLIEQLNDDNNSLSSLDKGILHKIGKDYNMGIFTTWPWGGLWLNKLRAVGDKYAKGGMVLPNVSGTIKKFSSGGYVGMSLPMPEISGGFYASGGSVSGGGAMDTLLDIMTSMRDEIISLKTTVMDSKPIIDIHVDPLSSDPVKISEIAEAGTRIRSTI